MKSMIGVQEDMLRNNFTLMMARCFTSQQDLSNNVGNHQAITRLQWMRHKLVSIFPLIVLLLIAATASHADEKIIHIEKKSAPGAVIESTLVPKAHRSRLLIVNATQWVIGNRSLTKEQLARRVSKLIEEDAKNLSRRNLRDLEEFYQSNVLEDWVEIALLADEAEAKGFSVTPPELEQKLDALQATSEPHIDLEKALKSLGVTREEFRNEMRDALLGEKLIRMRLAQMYPEEKLREIYNTMPQKFITPPQVRVSQIFRAVSGDKTKKEKKAIYDDMVALHRRAVAGEDFATLAKASDAPSKDRGGDIGWVTAVNALPKPLDSLIFQLKVGEISKVVESQFGYHIIKITDTRPATGLKFEDARPAVENYVFGTARNSLLEEIKSTRKITVIFDGQRKEMLLAPSGPRISTEPLQ
jgi:peptidyl-prolyl cis-trans isomerase C